jgi:NCAIR mutase (PurE)-related protein
MAEPPNNLDEVLAAVAGGALPPREAAERLRRGEVRYLEEFAVLDLGRAERKGVPEIVYAPGKTPEGVARICASILEHRERIIVSNPTQEHEEALRESLPGIPVERAGRALVAGTGEPTPTGGHIVAISAGSSDLPVLE